MRQERGGWKTMFIRLIGLLIVITGPIQAGELLIPDDVFFYRPVASVFGQSSVWNNPAALGYQRLGTMVAFTHRNDDIVRDWGGAVTLKMFAVAYRKVKFENVPNLDDYLFALGGGENLKIGLSYRYLASGPGYLNNRHLWNLAILLRNTKNLSIGARFENLNRGRIDGERSDIRFVYGTAARVYRDLVTVSFDVDMTQKENLDKADFRTGIEVRPVPGMYLYADFDNHSRFNLGFRLNFGSNYAGHYHNFDRKAKSYRGTTSFGSVKGKQPSITKPRRKSMTVRLDGTLPENPKIPVFGKKPLRFFDYVDGIYRAADDDEIDRLFLKIGALKCGLGKVEELSEAVKYFRSQGKQAYAFIETPNNLGYLLASTADSIIIPPVSQLSLTGLYANLITIKGLMDKVGVKAEIERIDEHKSAPERYMFDRPSEPYRKQVNRILDNAYAEMVTAISENREISRDSIKSLIDKAPLLSVEARDYGLIDTLAYLDEAVEYYGGRRTPVLSRRISLDAYVQREDYYDYWGERPRVALIIADGDIAPGNTGGRIGDYEMLAAIRRVRQDSRVKGVVLRVNSPGGSALASDLIWHEIAETAKKKPLLISMGNMAASGGYYISSIEGEIFVNRSTLTGSIGVYGGKANISELLDKVGIYTESYKRGRNAGLFSMYEPFTPDQRLMLKDQMKKFYRHFTEKVGQVRNITADSVDALGGGRVWSGTEAVRIGLADRIGGCYQALETLCSIVNVSRDEALIVSYPKEKYYFKNPFDLPSIYRILADLIADGKNKTMVSGLMENDYIFYRLPYNLEIE